MSQGIKASVKGKDVRRATGRDLLVNTDLNVMKTQMELDPAHQGILEKTIPSSLANGEVEFFKIPHGKPYIPAAIVFDNRSGSTIPLPKQISGLVFPGPVLGVSKIEYYVDRTALYIIHTNENSFNGFAGEEHKFIYRIFVEEIVLWACKTTSYISIITL